MVNQQKFAKEDIRGKTDRQRSVTDVWAILPTEEKAPQPHHPPTRAQTVSLPNEGKRSSKKHF